MVDTTSIMLELVPEIPRERVAPFISEAILEFFGPATIMSPRPDSILTCRIVLHDSPRNFDRANATDRVRT